MDRRAKLRTRAFGIGGAALALALLAAPRALATAPATDEYSIDLPGVTPSTVPSLTDEVDPARDAALPLPQAGVVGETSPPQSSLDSVGSLLGDAPLVALGALLLLAIALLAARRRAQSA